MAQDSIDSKVTRRASTGLAACDARREHPSDRRGASGPTGIPTFCGRNDVYSSAYGSIGGVRNRTT